MHAAARDGRQTAREDVARQRLSVRGFPCVELGSELDAAVPKMRRLAGDGDAALAADRARDLGDVAVGRDVPGNAQAQHVRRAVADHRVFGEIDARDENHAVLFPGALGFGLEDLHVEGEHRGQKSAVHVDVSFAQERVGLAEMVRDRDRAEAARAVEVHDPGDRELAVAERRIDVEVCENHRGALMSNRWAIKREPPGAGRNRLIPVI